MACGDLEGEWVDLEEAEGGLPESTHDKWGGGLDEGELEKGVWTWEVGWCRKGNGGNGVAGEIVC